MVRGSYVPRGRSPVLGVIDTLSELDSSAPLIIFISVDLP